MGRGFGDAEEPLAEVGLSRDPAEAAARSDSFRESVKADNAALIVDGEIGGDERVEEREAGRLLGCGVILNGGHRVRFGLLHRGCIGVRPRQLVCRGILEVPIWVVFNDYDIEFDTYSIDVFAALDTKETTSRVLANAMSTVSPLLQ